MHGRNRDDKVFYGGESGLNKNVAILKYYSLLFKFLGRIPFMKILYAMVTNKNVVGSKWCRRSPHRNANKHLSWVNKDQSGNDAPFKNARKIDSWKFIY